MSSPEPRPMRGGETRVFLENLPKDVRKDEIDREFSVYGRIAKVYLIYNPPGSGFVEFFESDDARIAASSMDNVEFLGSKLRTQLTRGGVPRGRGPSRGGGRYSSNRGDGFSGGGSYRSRDEGYSGGGSYRSRDDGYSMGGGGFRSRGFRPRGRRNGNDGSYGSSRGFSSRGGYNKGFSGSGGFSRGGGRGFSRGREGGSRSYSNRYDDEFGSKYDTYADDASPNGYDKYESSYKYRDYDDKGYGKYESMSKYGGYEKSYDKHDLGHSKYSSYSGMGHKDSYQRSRSPLGYSEDYRSASGSYPRTSSSYASRRSPMDERY